MRATSVIALAALTMVAAEGCHGDNLLRGMERHNASAYCSSVLFSWSMTTTLTVPEGVPTGFESGPVSSACACLLRINSTLSRSPCHSKTEVPTEESSRFSEATATSASSTRVSDTVASPTATNSGIGGGYSFSVPDGPLTSSTASTCAWSEATTTVQVTETSIETVYVTSLPSNTNGASGGRPPPPPSSLLDSSTADAQITSSDSVTGITLSGEPTGTASGLVSTITLTGDLTSTGDVSGTTLGIPILTTMTGEASTFLSTVTRTPLVPSQGRPGATITLIINGTATTITGELPDPPTSTSTPTSSAGGLGASQWTLSWISGTTESIPAGTITSRLTTITSDVGNGVVSTWTETVGVTTDTSSSGSTTPTRTQEAVTSVITSLLAGGATTITVTGGSSVVNSANGTSSTLNLVSSEAVSAGSSSISTITGGQETRTISGGIATFTTVIGGVVTTVTVNNGSTLVPSSQGPFSSPTATSSETLIPGFTVITTVLGGIETTLTVSNGSTWGPSSEPATAASTTSPSQTLPPGFTFVSTVIGGAVTTVIVSGDSTISPLSTTSTATSSSILTDTISVDSTSSGGTLPSTASESSTLATPSTSSSMTAPTVSDGVVLVTTVIQGITSILTVSNGVTFGVSSSRTSSPNPTISGGGIVITTIINGELVTRTISNGATLGQSSASATSATTSETGTPSDSTTGPTLTASGGVVVISTVINGATSVFTVSDDATLGRPTSSSSIPTPTPTSEIIAVTTIVDGQPITLTVSNSIAPVPTGVTVSPTSSANGGVIVIISTISGDLSTWTVTNTSIIAGLETSNSASSPSQTATLPPTGGAITATTVINGSTVTSTISNDMTSSDTSTPAPTATGVITVISGASSWIVSNGVTPSASSNATTTPPTPAGQLITVTSIINGVPTTLTISNGSTPASSPITTTTPTPTWQVVTLTSTAADGSVSVWTITGGTTSALATNATGTSTSPSSIVPTSVSPTSSGFDSAFTGITIVAAQSATSCYSLPAPTESLRESRLENQGEVAPHIDAFFLNETTSAVQYLRLVDSSSDPILLDVSDPSRLAIVDKDGDVLSVDSQGLHFSSARCSPKIDIFISGFFEQLDTLTNSTCANQPSVPANGTEDQTSTGTREKRQVTAFDALLRLKDQCGNPARSDLPVIVALGDSTCTVDARDPGDFVATCSFPGDGGSSAECETSVQRTLDRLTQGSFAGTCPSFKSVWTLLFQQLRNVVNIDQLLRPFVDAGLDVDTDTGRSILSNIDSYLGLFDYATSTFQNSTSQAGSGLGDMIESYGVTTIQTQVCRSLLGQDALNLTFTAGSSTTTSLLAELTAIPSPPPEFERNVTDPTSTACCPNPGTCIKDDQSRRYPDSSRIEGSDCLCGTRADGGGIAFRTGRCLEFDQCNITTPCAEGLVCLVDSCCDKNVCVNGTECSAPQVVKRWANLFGSDTLAGIF